jgi:uncharacterized LabA/DUF88 family protein
MSSSVALFLDVPNIQKPLEALGVSFDARPVLERVRTYGKIVIANAYANFETVPVDIQFRLVGLGMFLANCPAYCNGSPQKKATTDSLLMRDAFKALYRRKIDTFVIGSGDGHFIPLASAVREHGRRFVALSIRECLCHHLRDTADEVILWPVIAKPSAQQKQFPPPSSTGRAASSMPASPAAVGGNGQREELIRAGLVVPA